MSDIEGIEHKQADRAIVFHSREPIPASELVEVECFKCCNMFSIRPADLAERQTHRRGVRCRECL